MNWKMTDLFREELDREAAATRRVLERVPEGRGDWKPRAQRLAAAWPKLSEDLRASEYADLRYPGGFAVKRVATVTPVSPAASPGRAKKK